MIIHSKVFKRIEKIAEEKNSYNYILLYFMSDRIELIFSNVDEYVIRYALEYFPLLVIYDKDRHSNMMHSNLLDDIFAMVLNRRVSDSNKELILQSFDCIDYDYITDEKDEILQRISHVLLINSIFSSIDKLDINFLIPSNIKAIKKELALKKKNNLTIEQILDSSSIADNYDEYLYVSGLMKKNINKILSDYDVLELKELFYHQKLKTRLNKSDNEYLKKESNFFTTADKLQMLNLLDKKKISDKANEIYKEILLECKYINLYDFNYDTDYKTFEYLFDDIYGSMTYNKVTSLSTNFIESDYINTLIEQEVDSSCFDKVLKEMYKIYGFDFTSYSYDEIKDYTIKEVGLTSYSDLQMLDTYIDDMKETIKAKSQKLEQKCLENYVDNTQSVLAKYQKTLKNGKFKHKKA